MIRDLLVCLEYEIQRQPDLAAFAARVDQLSEAEIRATDVAMPWMTDALLQLKTKRYTETLSQLVETWVIDGQTPDAEGITRQWVEADGYMRIGRTELMIRQGQLIWLDRTGIWIDTIHTTFIDPKLKTHTVFYRRMTRAEYYETVRAQHNVTPVERAPTSQVRFFRPP